MKNGKKGAAKGFVVFLCAMAALTFLSHTIYYNTLPKVSVERVRSGVLQTVIEGNSFLYESDQVVRIDLPLNLSDYVLLVESVPVVTNGVVRREDPLLYFDPVVGDDALQRAEAAFGRAEAALNDWDRRYTSACQALNAELATLAKELSEPGADADALSEKMRNAREALSSLEQTGILEGESRGDAEQALLSAMAKRDVLDALKQGDWTLKAETDGLVGEVRVASGDEYGGLLPLFRLFPAEAKILVGVETDSSVKIDYDQDVVIFVGDVQPQGYETGWAYAGETVRDGRRVLWAEPQEGLSALKGIQLLTFRISSEYYSELVPNSAILDEALYVLDSREGAFGMEERYARRVEVRTGASDGANTYIPMGLNGDELVIVLWDRPFGDGDAVALPLD